MQLSRLIHPTLRTFAVYGVATGLAAVLTLVQTRVLWRGLTHADFGTWSLIDPMLLPTASLVLFGIDHSIVKQLRVDRLPLRIIVGTLLTTTLPATTLCLLVIGFISNIAIHLAWVDALIFTLAGEALILITQTAFRAAGSVGLFSVILLSRNLLYLLILLIIRAQNEEPWLPFNLIFLTRGGCVILISLVALAALRPIPRVDWARYQDALQYGFPLLLTTFIYALTDMTDRWFLAEFTGVVAVGEYALHLKVAAILSQAIVIPFGMWFPPERFKRLDDADEGRRFFIRTAAVLALICGYLSGVVWLARNLVLPLIAPGVVASPLVLACCLGGVTCLALSQALNVGLLMPGHTGKNAICSGFAAATIVLAAGFLVPLFGMNGAAIARLFGGLILLSATAAWSYRVFPLSFPFGAMLLYYVVSTVAAVGIDRATTAFQLWPDFMFAQIAWAAVTAGLAIVGWNRIRAAEQNKRPQPSLS